MPELPEVETVMRGLAPVMCGARVKAVTINRHDLRGGVPIDFAARVNGGVIGENLIRRGKYICMPMDTGFGIILHLGMSGRCKVFEPHQHNAYIPAPHDHVVIEMQSGARVVYNDPRRFGMMYLTPMDTWQTHKPFSAMGPEPLDDAFTGDVLMSALHAKSKASIKAALLDQRVVAGVGNIYACEALYHARIHPERLANQLNIAACDALVTAIKDVLNRAINAGGSTLRDHKQTDGSQGYFQHVFKVYDRADTVCDRCNGSDTSCITRIVQSGRSTFYCRNTQV